MKTAVMRLFVVIAVSSVLVGLPFASAQVVPDPKLPAYTKVAGINGPLRLVGAGEAEELCERWIAEFCRIHAPNVQAELQCTHSTTALANLVKDNAVAGIMCREASPRELAAFEQKTGHAPTALRVAIDMVAIYVHKDNPIATGGLTVQQLDAIYSKTRRKGATKDIVKWGQLGLTGEWADKPINIHGRNAASDLYRYFSAFVLAGGEFKDTLRQEMRNAAVVQSVAADRYAIGFSSVRSGSDAVAPVPVRDADGNARSPEPGNATSYPLLRYLNMYVDLKPGSKPGAMREGFLRYLLSKEGQRRVAAAGYLPMDAEAAGKELAKLGLD